jgi:hypothetical protein
MRAYGVDARYSGRRAFDDRSINHDADFIFFRLRLPQQRRAPQATRGRSRNALA